MPIFNRHSYRAGQGCETPFSPLRPSLLSLALAAGLLGMNAPAGAQSAATFQTVENPPVFQASDSLGSTTATVQAGRFKAPVAATGRRSINLNVGYVNTFIWNPTTDRFDRVRLRSYHGRSDQPLVAPTINVSPGSTLDIQLNNRLPADDPSCQNLADNSHNTPNCFNTTNLHTHGLWVDPGQGNTTEAVASDNVFLNIKPGQSQRYAIQIPADHPAGTFWYHSHVHGSTALQVSSGMAGALIVRGNRFPTNGGGGDLDTLLRPSPRHRVQERLLVLQQIQYACRTADGKIKTVDGNDTSNWKCDEGDVGAIENYDVFGGNTWEQSGRFTTVNGRTLPIFAGARAGRFERWRMIHAGVRDTINLQFRQAAIPWGRTRPNFAGMNAEQLRNFVSNVCTGQPLIQHKVAADGLTLNYMQADVNTVFQPGYRWDTLMVFPRAGYYCVLDAANAGNSNGNSAVNGTPVQQLLGIVAVQPGVEMSDAQIPAHVRRQLTELARDNMPASVRDAVMRDASTLHLTRFTPHRTINPQELTEPTETITFGIGGSPGAFTFEVDGKPYEPGVMGRQLKLGGVQEWHMKTALAGHPFHIHVNPFQIIAILDPSGRDVSGLDMVDDNDGSVDPQFRGMKGMWKDTIFVKPGTTRGTSYTVIARTRYERYHGDFVLHCHILDHEDQGMMQHVRIYDPARPETRTRPVPGHNHGAHQH